MISRKKNLPREIFVDNFAGGGGASTGIELAIGRSVDIAINHDPAAIAMHKVNHPNTKHYTEDVWAVDPVDACAGRSVALAWFSPDCKHFSRAKGGKPVDKNIRGLAWVIIKWAYLVHPRVIMMENVPEIVTWGPLGKDNRPIKSKQGDTFAVFLGMLTTGVKPNRSAIQEACDAIGWKRTSIEMQKILRNGLGYNVEFRKMRSCDYGAPTSRERFYMIARCDGAPIRWPEPTHAPKGSFEVLSGEKQPYHTAAECIDWSIPCQSIFEREKPLAENTLRRIARGIKKFVIDNPNPFIVTVNHKGDGFRGQDIKEPLGTVTAKNGYGVVVPTIMCNNANNVGKAADSPLPTVTTGNRNFLVAPTITAIGQTGTKDRSREIDKPLSTVCSKAEHLLVAPSLIQYHSEQQENEVRGQELTEPIQTLDTSNRYALSVAAIMKNYAGGYSGAGSSVEDPLHTVTATDHNALLTAHILTLRNNQDGQELDEPLSTVTAGGLHHAEVEAFLIKYFSTGSPKPVDEPLDTITTKDRFAVVTIHGEEYVITDIRMRMLQPKELFKAQGFPDDYIIDHDADGNPYPKKEQVAKCGNAVTPPTAAALVRANLPEYCGKTA